MDLDLSESHTIREFDIDNTDCMYDSSMTFKTEKMAYPCVEDGHSPTYTDLSNYSFKAFKTEPSFCSSSTGLLRWTQRHPEHWTSAEVLDWVFYVAEDRMLDTVRGESFQNVSGLDLCKMELTGFIMRDPNNGALLFDVFRRLIDSEKFVAPPFHEFKQTEDRFAPVLSQLLEDYDEDGMDMSEALDNNLKLVHDVNGGMKVALNGEWYPIDFNYTAVSDTFVNMDPGYASDSNSDGSTRHGSCSSSGSDIFSDIETTTQPKPSYQKRSPKYRQRNSTSTSSDDGSENDTKKSNRGRRTGQLSKGNHLWEFIRDLLKNSSFNPNLLKWEDKESGVFKFVQSEAVAQMWGRKKNNPGMTYEKLSRAMRFCRTAGYFAAVPKNGKFPKKLCFKFGHKAFDWKSE